MDETEWGPRLQAEKDRLEQTRRDLDEDDLNLSSERESLGDLSDLDRHPADTGTETFNRERDMAIAEQVAAELDEVEAALERLENGTYGTCLACGRPIEPDRLEALPATRFCLADQARAEGEAAAGA